jgi:hypothetical protein
VLSETRDQWMCKSCANESADAGCSKRKAVLPGFEPEVPEHEDGEQRRGRHDEAIDQDRVEEQRAQPVP